MSEHRNRDPLDDPVRQEGEPIHLPSQAEGPDDGEDDEPTLHLRTGGQAEGTIEDVEDQLRRQEAKDRQSRRP